MFTHILLPTDGSELSQAACLKGLRFARECDARVTGICVTPQFHVFTLNATMIEDTEEQFRDESRAQAKKHLEWLSKAAAEVGVRCETVVEVGDHPFEAIIRTAETQGCDLIVMASHGRRGVQGVLIGSETQKVLTHTQIPVLVYR